MIWNLLFSINFGIPKVNPKATRASKIIGFLNKARGETKKADHKRLKNDKRASYKKLLLPKNTHI